MMGVVICNVLLLLADRDMPRRTPDYFEIIHWMHVGTVYYLSSYEVIQRLLA